jgi:hypothetical protein
LGDYSGTGHATSLVEALTKTTKLEGCKGRGGSFCGAVRFLAAINPVLTNISKNRSIERVTIIRPAFGLPAIIVALEMLPLLPRFSTFSASQTLLRDRGKIRGILSVSQSGCPYAR